MLNSPVILVASFTSTANVFWEDFVVEVDGFELVWVAVFVDEVFGSSP